MSVGILSLVAACSFLVGSFPTAYVLVRLKSGRDLRQEGSGNIGTLNAYEVSRSRAIGIAVLLIDLCKGALPVIGVLLLAPSVFWYGATAMMAVVAGHNYSPWIGFKGGRGLAPAAGAALVMNPMLLIVWLLAWGAAFAVRHNVHVGNIAASIALPAACVAMPWLGIIASRYDDPQGCGTMFLAAAVAFLFLVRHIDPMKQLFTRDH